MKRQRGVALITAILVVAIATVAAAAVLASSAGALRRTATMQDTERGWWYAQGVESWVLTILKKDAQDNHFDGLGEPWSMCITALPVDEGTASGQIIDDQGRFNLNNLDPRAGGGTVDYGAMFQRLLAQLQNLSSTPTDLVGPIRDWIDENDAPSFPVGAEDMNYLGMTPPYRAANRLMRRTSELLAVQGITPEIYRALMTQCPVAEGIPAPCITVLPQHGTTVNVNTASAAVLRSLSATQPDEIKLEQFLKERIETPVEDLQAFYAKGVLAADANNQVIDVRSRFFTLQGDIFVGSGHVALYSSIYRPDPGVPVVLSRSTVPELAGTKPCATPSTSP